MLSEEGAPAATRDGTVATAAAPPVDPARAHARSTLAAWSVLEALSPTTYGEPRDLAEGGWTTLGPLREDRLPWLQGDVPRENYVYYYRLSLGSIDMRVASRALVTAYGQDEGRQGPRGHHAVLAMALVDAAGVPVNKSLSASSFAWALPLVLGKDLSDMGRWGEVEADVLAHVAGLMTRVDPNDPDKVAPVRWEDVIAAHRYLVERFALPPEFVGPPTFSLRVEHRQKARNEPGPYLLNSFYLRDIEQAMDLVDEGKEPRALRGYLGIAPVPAPVDVLRSRPDLVDLLAPRATPHARWPSPGGQGLVTLQQAATNAAHDRLAPGDGIQSVNGPPGTGKTTQLRDVVAACILRRASAMAGFEDPREAFVEVVDDTDDGRRRVRRPFRLAPGLAGHEVLVASSNNRAVENISRELPMAKALGRPDLGLRYFRTLSDAVAGITADPRRQHENEGRERTWGLAAAALGNAENRHRFLQTFWWDEDHGMRTWLRLAQGQKVTVHVKDKKGRLLESRPPHLIVAEQPPMTQADAASRWAVARARFLRLQAALAREFEELDAYAWSVANWPGLAAEVDRKRAEVEALSAAPTVADVLAARLADARAETAAAEAASAAHDAAEPETGAEWTLWDIERADILHRIEGLRQRAERLLSSLEQSGAAVSEPAPALGAARARLAQAEETYRTSGELMARLRPVVGERTVDDAFFARGHEAWNTSVPWMTERLQGLREEMFAAAVELHEAFALAAAERLQVNLSAFVEMMGSGGASPELAGRAADLWASLFLVVPVVSTTFASVGRMLGGLPPSSLGWLVVDEAGQAVPQAAVGAMFRCRRALVVGDPRQIEPVTQLPHRLTERVCAHFGVERRTWTGPEASVQTLADAASPLRADLRGDGGGAVGLPLLVHRRCQEPMFGIANRVAYSGQMVFASGPARDGSVTGALGPSAWMDVTGEHEGKWCPEQGEAVVEILRALAKAGARNPDVYVISPFREVAGGIQRRLQREPMLFRALNEDSWEFARYRVGTIHTFQGREAEGVVLVLGAGADVHAGARAWACATPNIVNVAVSRAKSALYVVGDRTAWAEVGAARELAACLPEAAVPGRVLVPRAPAPEPAAAPAVPFVARTSSVRVPPPRAASGARPAKAVAPVASPAGKATTAAKPAPRGLSGLSRALASAVDDEDGGGEE